MASAKMIEGLGPRPKEPRFILENQYGVYVYNVYTGHSPGWIAVFDAHFQMTGETEHRYM